jgi:hypothetical protein
MNKIYCYYPVLPYNDGKIEIGSFFYYRSSFKDYAKRYTVIAIWKVKLK